MKKHAFLIMFICAFFIGINAMPAAAHRPHDLIRGIALSGDYGKDRTAVILVRNSVFRTQDSGETWKRITAGLDNLYPYTSVRASVENSEIFYLSTRGEGIYKSIDNGNSWEQTSNSGLDDLLIGRMAVTEKSGADLLIASAGDVLYVSGDGAGSWRKVKNFEKPISAIGVGQNLSGLILAGTKDGRVFLSEDAGYEWRSLRAFSDGTAVTALSAGRRSEGEVLIFAGTDKEGLFVSLLEDLSFKKTGGETTGKHITDVALSPSFREDNKVFVSTRYNGVFFSDDAGTSWVKRSRGLTKDKQADSMNMPHFSEIAVSPVLSEDHTLFLEGFAGLFRSMDEGKTWGEVETLSPGTITAFDVSPEYSDDGTIAACSYVTEGIWISEDGGKNWFHSDRGLERPMFDWNFNASGQDPRRFFDIEFSPDYSEDGTIFATVLYNKVLRSSNRGRSWDMTTLPKGARGPVILVSPAYNQDNTVLVISQAGEVFRSGDKGSTFKAIGKMPGIFGNDPPSAVISPDFKEDKTLFAATKKGVYVSTNAGKDWREANTGIDTEKVYSIRLAISPDHAKDGTVFAATNAGLYKTTDRGSRWEKIRDTAFGGDSYIESIAVSPEYADDRTLLVSVRGKGLFTSTDGGETFKRVCDETFSLSGFACPHSTEAIIFSPDYARDRTIFGTGTAGKEILVSKDAGKTWSSIRIPRMEKDSYGFFTKLTLFSKIYKRKLLAGFLLIFFLALFAGLVGYIFLRSKEQGIQRNSKDN